MHRIPDDVPALAARLASHLAAAEAAQIARLDTCYRTLAAAAAASRNAEQEAVLRYQIGAYFEGGADASTASRSVGADGARPSHEVTAAAAPAVVDGDPLAGLPLREPPPALALDVRELLAFARRSGGSGGAKGIAAQVLGTKLWPPSKAHTASPLEQHSPFDAGGKCPSYCRMVANVSNPAHQSHACASLKQYKQVSSALLPVNATACACMSSQGRSLTGRATARIMHGVASPAFPADQWSKCGFWGRYADVDFGAVQKTAARVLSAVKEVV